MSPQGQVGGEALSLPPCQEILFWQNPRGGEDGRKLARYTATGGVKQMFWSSRVLKPLPTHRCLGSPLNHGENQEERSTLAWWNRNLLSRAPGVCGWGGGTDRRMDGWTDRWTMTHRLSKGAGPSRERTQCQRWDEWLPHPLL